MTFLKKFAQLVALSLPFISANLFAQEETGEPVSMSEEERAEKLEELTRLARAYLGSEKALDAVESIEMSGVLVYGTGQSGTVESVFLAPNYHQFTSVIAGKRETSTLNKTEAWQKIESLREPGVYNLNFYLADDVRHLEATVLDTLSFLGVPPTRRGRIEYLGTQEVEGVQTEVLLYLHSDRIWFRRYIDAETGRVLHMVNDKGVIFTYKGDIEVDGVKFPETVVVRMVTQFGERTMEVSYNSIRLNGSIDSERFRVPQMGE